MTKYLLAAFAAIALLGFTGCATSPQQSAGKTLSSIAVSVDSAMQGWAKWVVIQRNNPAASQAEILKNEGKVKTAYENYQAAMRLAKGAYLSAVTDPTVGATALDSAMLVLKENEKSLLNLIASFTK